MTIGILYASRYGSTEAVSRWLAERLTYDAFPTAVLPVSIDVSPEDYDVMIFGGGVYSHDLLPGVDDYIRHYQSTLQQKKTAVFGVAMQTEPVYTPKGVAGGILMLEKYAELLGSGCVHLGMLKGEMVYHRMSPEDQAGIDQFYKMLKLSKEEIEKRKAPRTEMSKTDVWAFAESVAQKLKGAKYGH